MIFLIVYYLPDGSFSPYIWSHSGAVAAYPSLPITLHVLSRLREAKPEMVLGLRLISLESTTVVEVGD